MCTPPRFPLIELLVVIAIIALLLAILVPSLKSAQDAAKTAVCLANLKNIGTAVGGYTSQSSGYLVPMYVQYGDGLYALWPAVLQDAGMMSGVDSTTEDVPATRSVVRCPSDLPELAPHWIGWGEQRTGAFRTNPERMQVFMRPRQKVGGDATHYTHTSYGINGGNDEYWGRRSFAHPRLGGATGFGGRRVSSVPHSLSEVLSVFDGYAYHMSGPTLTASATIRVR